MIERGEQRPLRDTFAVAALNGIVRDLGYASPQDAASKAYALADAMLQEREKKSPPAPAADGTEWPTSGALVALTDDEQMAIEIAIKSTTVCIPPIKDTLCKLLKRITCST